MQSLTPCPSCHRHVMTLEVACPFCAAALTQHMAGLPARPLPRARLGRSALFVFGATAALTSMPLSGCSDDGADPPGKSRDASASTRTSGDAGAETHVSSTADAALAAVSDASPARDAQAVARDAAAEASTRSPDADPGNAPIRWDAGDDIGIPIYASVAAPLPFHKHEQPAPTSAPSRHARGTPELDS